MMIRVYFKKLENGNLEITENMLNDILSHMKRQDDIIDKINKLYDYDTHCENIYYAIGVVLNKKYHDIDDVWEKNLLNIIKGENKN